MQNKDQFQVMTKEVRAFSRNWDEDTSRSISSKTAKGSIKTGVNGDFSVIEGGKLPKALCDQYKTSIVKDTQFQIATD